jgi:AcrR family transcriptional regulator
MVSREDAIQAALEVAAEEGVRSVTFRRVGRHLGIGAMGVHHHVGSKTLLLIGMVEKLNGHRQAKQLRRIWDDAPGFAESVAQVLIEVGLGNGAEADMLSWVGLEVQP